MKDYDDCIGYTEHDEVRRLDETNRAGTMTMRDIREFVSRYNELPDDTIVVIHRVEDSYFENNNWGVIDTAFEGRVHEGVLHTDYVNGIPAFAIYVTHTKSKNKVILVTPHY